MISSSLCSPSANHGTPAEQARRLPIRQIRCVLARRARQEGPPGYSPGVGKFDSDIFNGLDNLYPGGPFDPLGAELPFRVLARLQALQRPFWLPSRHLARTLQLAVQCNLCFVMHAYYSSRAAACRPQILEKHRVSSYDLAFGSS